VEQSSRDTLAAMFWHYIKYQYVAVAIAHLLVNGISQPQTRDRTQRSGFRIDPPDRRLLREMAINRLS
jgi:hypothetical protein